ncbi:hypothetical protein SAMN05421670_3698 [Psychrobacillus psychrotolerans]|uniref:Uncharacterized protein n=1 Tax=Psychrobacillus psychrotolerans TaxID=126156 RepID=A0A1I6AX15_9BACI|nr:hypothetical protein [Psychrobacillus psychrotolerans]SFQ73224.1 hypothetical protein SAMN05421670_3698 [Psychrobacillus psychrotolerans]
MKRFLFIFLSTVIVGGVFYMGMDYQMRLRERSAIVFDIKPFIIFTSIFSIFMGMLLRLPKLIIEIKDKKRWSIDWVKVLVIGIPSIYIAMIRLLAIVYGKNLLFFNEVTLLGDFTFTYIAGVIFGYVLLDSLKSNDSSNDKGKLA